MGNTAPSTRGHSLARAHTFGVRTDAVPPEYGTYLAPGNDRQPVLMPGTGGSADSGGP